MLKLGRVTKVKVFFPVPVYVFNIFGRHFGEGSIRAGPVQKMDEHKHDQHEDIGKKVDIFHSLNGILTKTRECRSKYKKLPKSCLSYSFRCACACPYHGPSQIQT